MKLASLALILIVATPLAFAASSDDELILRHCGHPLNESRGLSPTTNEWQLDFTYPDDVVLHLRPVNGGWTFVSAWMKHLPLSRERAAERFQCLREALAESSAAPTAVDPTIAAQVHDRTYLAETGSSVPFLWLILVLAATLFVIIFIPARRRRLKRELPAPRSPQRKPEVVIKEERRASGIHQVR